MKIKVLMIFFGIILLLWSSAQAEVKDQVDSLFVIASSGELKYRDLVEPAIDEIANLGAEAVPVLIDKFTTKSARERLTIIKILKKIGSPAVPALVGALERSDGLIVQRVCWALGDIADSTALEPLIKVADHPRWQVRDQAIGALGKIGDGSVGQTVFLALTDTVGQVRKAAAVAAGKLELNQAVELLVHLMGDRFYGARMSAVHSLLKLDTVMVIKVISDSVLSSSQLLGNLGCYVLGELATASALEILFKQSHSPNPERRAHAAVALIKADPEDESRFVAEELIHETNRWTLMKIRSVLPDSSHAR